MTSVTDTPSASEFSEDVAQKTNPIDRLIWSVALRFGTKAKEVERFLKFLVVGTLGATIDLGILNLLQSTMLPPSGPHEVWNIRLAATIAFVTAVSSNFVWHRYWTYPDSRSRPIPLQVVQFFSVNIVAVGMRLVLVSLLYRPLGSFAQDLIGNEAWDTEKINQIGTNLSQMISMGIALFWNFFANRYWTYGDVD